MQSTLLATTLPLFFASNRLFFAATFEPYPGIVDFAEYQIVAKDHAGLMRKLLNDSEIPWSAYLGVAGMPGRTAWYGWQEMCDAKKVQFSFTFYVDGVLTANASLFAGRDHLCVDGRRRRGFGRCPAGQTRWAQGYRVRRPQR